MKKLLFLVAFGLLIPSLVMAGNAVNDRVVRGAVVLREIHDAPDGGIPNDLLNKSVCVAVIPGMKKGGFIFGANYGRGLMSCRTNRGDGPWSAPAMFRLEGGSFGLQIGAQSVPADECYRDPSDHEQYGRSEVHQRGQHEESLRIVPLHLVGLRRE